MDGCWLAGAWEKAPSFQNENGFPLFTPFPCPPPRSNQIFSPPFLLTFPSDLICRILNCEKLDFFRSLNHEFPPTQLGIRGQRGGAGNKAKDSHNYAFSPMFAKTKILRLRLIAFSGSHYVLPNTYAWSLKYRVSKKMEAIFKFYIILFLLDN